VIRTAALVTLCLLSSTSLFAQGGSNYSSFGLGDIVRSVGARYEGMAGTAIAMPSLQGINVVNPALLGMSPFTRIQTGYRFEQHLVQGAQGGAAQTSGEVDGLLALFAVDTSMGLGVSFGVLPYSNIAYSTTREFITTGPQGNEKGSSSQFGSGGISSIYLGASYRVKGIYLGASAQPLFGQMIYSDDNVVSSITNLSSFSLQTKYLMTGATYRLGAYTEVMPALNVGAYYSFASQLSFDKTVTQTAYTRELFDTLNLRGRDEYTFFKASSSGTSSLPTVVGVGLSYKSGRTQVGLDIEQGSFSNMTINQRNEATVGSMFRATIGVSQQAAGYAPTFFDKWGYRGGLGYVQQYFTYRGQTIHEAFASVGFDFPLGQSATVDAALQAGFRGPSTGLYEYIGRFAVTVSIGEVWFKPFARD
jgi:hypothetical protein